MNLPQDSLKIQDSQTICFPINDLRISIFYWNFKQNFRKLYETGIVVPKILTHTKNSFTAKICTCIVFSLNYSDASARTAVGHDRNPHTVHMVAASSLNLRVGDL